MADAAAQTGVTAQVAPFLFAFPGWPVFEPWC